MPELVAEFCVYGVAKTAGSKKAFIPRRKDGSMVTKANGKPMVVVTDDTGKAGKDWRSDVKSAAEEFFVNRDTGEIHRVDGPVVMEITFHRHRPKSHYGSGKNAKFVKDSAPAFPITKPDADKLSRAVLDALTGLAWNDDAQVTEKLVRKRYAETDFTEIKIFRADQQSAIDLPLEERVRGSVPFAGPSSAQASLLAA